ncbi:hypothetical protein DPMN_077878 [Dreissena polymorpha]|uniref:Secreted protein n=1 Tax=Dreissena polymorpha TaxID=45954 RepID=A0A9D3YLP2_DREPO|nr:hypothetical protein DPMN_077878 [Dreissena polymorpha]
MTSTVTYICVFVLATSVCLSSVSEAYIDCFMECLFARFRQPTVCGCNYNVKPHRGKRASRTQTQNGRLRLDTGNGRLSLTTLL